MKHGRPFCCTTYGMLASAGRSLHWISLKAACHWGWLKKAEGTCCFVPIRSFTFAVPFFAARCGTSRAAASSSNLWRSWCSWRLRASKDSRGSTNWQPRRRARPGHTQRRHPAPPQQALAGDGCPTPETPWLPSQQSPHQLCEAHSTTSQ